MHAEDLRRDDGSNGQAIEDIDEGFPCLQVTPSFAFVVEAVDLGDLPGLVVATDEGDALGVADFEGEEEEEGLDAVEAAVDEVAWRAAGVSVLGMSGGEKGDGPMKR